MTKMHLHARAEAYSDEPISTVHDRLFQGLAAHSKMCAGQPIPAAPQIKGGDLSTSRALRGFLPRGMTGHITYQFRRDANVHPISGHDWMSLDFKPDAGLYQNVVEDFIPALIHAMKPLMVELGDEKFDEPLWSAEGSWKVGGPLACGCGLHPVFFFSDWWLQEGYKLTQKQARQALEPLADRVTPMEEGLYVVGVQELVSFEDALERALRMEKSLRQAKPGLARFFRSLFRGGR